MAIGPGQDSTEVADAAQAASDEALRIFIDQAPAAIAMLDLNMCYLSASRRWKLDYDLGELDLHGMSHYEIFPEVSEQWKAIHRCALAGEVLRHDGERLKRIDGSTQWIRWEVRPWKSRSGNIGGVLIYSEDLTKLNSQEEALRETSEQLDAIIENAMDAIISVNESGDVVVFNASAELMFGCARANALGRPLATFIPSRFRLNHALQMRQFATEKESPRRMGRARVVVGLRSSGEEFPIEASISHASVGSLRLYTVIVRDVTATQQAQRELNSAHFDLRRLIEALHKAQDDERKRIARELHDDLQQTLVAIRMEVSVAEEHLRADPTRVAPVLSSIERLASAAVASTRRIVNDLRPLVLEGVDLISALQVMVSQFSQRTGIICHVEAQEDTDCAALHAPSITAALYRVVQEALNNVFKHAQATEALVHVARALNGELVLRVTDDGRGMSVEDSNKLQSFGLLGMQERVRSVGGKLRIDSQLGKGTTIEVVVPGSDVPPPHSSRQGEEHPNRSVGSMVGDDLRGFDQSMVGAGQLAVPNATNCPAKDELQSLIDSLPGNVALLDADGVIELVNRSWQDFARANGDPELLSTGPGVNNLDVCRRSAVNDKSAERVLDGLIAVLAGRIPSFSCTYPCHSPTEQRWFWLHATPTPGGGCMLTHFNLTSWVDPVRAQAPSDTEP
jgi:PAS domain S-box-containing protein